MATRRQGLATRASHAGTGGQNTRAVHPVLGTSPGGGVSHTAPIYQTTNFTYPDADAADRAAAGEGYLYTRHANPTTDAFASAVADLEDGEAGLAFASGLAAVAATTFALAGGGEILASEGIYGGTVELLRDLGQRHGLTARFVAGWDTEAVRAAVTPATKAILIETMTNPLLRVADVEGLAAVAKQARVPLIVDSTFASPVICRPLALGADVVVHSASKYLAGHGDVLGGVTVGRRELIGEVARYQKLFGGTMDPFAAWLATRGLRTLAVRMERQCATAARLADALSTMPGVRRVFYPGRTDHPDHARAARVLAAPGAIVSFEVSDGTAARRFYDRVQVFVRAASLGEVTSLVTHPASFSHRALSPEERARVGIGEGLLRLSVGIEDPADLEDDLRQALG